MIERHKNDDCAAKSVTLYTVVSLKGQFHFAGGFQRLRTSAMNLTLSFLMSRSTPSIRLTFRVAREPPGIGANCSVHIGSLC
jgi:hypothetical protein